MEENGKQQLYLRHRCLLELMRFVAIAKRSPKGILRKNRHGNRGRIDSGRAMEGLLIADEADTREASQKRDAMGTGQV